MTRVDKVTVGIVVLLLGFGAAYVIQHPPGSRTARSTAPRAAAPPRQGAAPPPREVFFPMEIEVSTGSFQLVLRNRTEAWYADCDVEVDDGWAFASSMSLTGGPKRIHLADFSKGGTRYDWQRRTPTRVVVTCRRFLANLDSEWVPRLSRWVGGF